MLTFRAGSAGSSFVATAMADHLQMETDVPELQERLAEYYGQGLKPEPGMTSGMPRRDMDPRVADVLGIDMNRPLRSEEIANILTGLRADGAAIPGKQVQMATLNKSRIAYIDLTFSCPKSASVSLCFSPTEAERAIVDRAHREAVDRTLEHIEEEIAWARRGHAGSKGADPGKVAWIQFHHYTARPTIKVASGEHTILQTVRVSGDPQRHTHCIIPSAVVTEGGHVGGLNQKNMRGRIHEWGALYQAFLATELRRAGIEAEYDKETGMARLPAVPRSICDLFSKRTKDGEAAARAYAERKGVDFDSLSGKQKADFLKAGALESREGKGDDLADYTQWHRQAKEAGYEHRSVLRPGTERDLADRPERLTKAYSAFLDILDPDLQRVAVFEGSTARIAAAKSLIVTGTDNAKDVNALTAAAREHGVQQEGQMTELVWGKLSDDRYAHFTTELHAQQEQETIDRFRKAAADKSSALTPEEIERAILEVESRRGIKYSSEQREWIYSVGTAGRSCAAIGGAGVGKSVSLEPIVVAKHARGQKTMGGTVAWRQTHGLADAGIGARQRRKSRTPDARRLEAAGVEAHANYALAKLLHGLERGYLNADRDTAIFVDEVGLVGTAYEHRLSILQEKLGFELIQIGDGKQCQSISAGSTIRLLQNAYGKDQVPELVTPIRQITAREKETTALFRYGDEDKVRAALGRMEEDGTLHIVPGGYREAIKAGVDLWERLVSEHKGKPAFSVGITVPTNSDARAVGEEVRARRKAAGEIAAEDKTLRARDQIGHQYDLKLAVGDRVRLFNTVFVYRNGKRPRFGENGSVMDVLAIRPDGLEMRNSNGNTGLVAFEQIKDQDTGRIRLTYGDAVTIDSRQSETLSHHITIAADGSRAVNGFKAYTTFSRHTTQSMLVTSQGAEQEEIVARRPMGDPRNQITAKAKVHEAIIANMARNLARQPEKQLATDLIAMANNVRKGAVRMMQEAWFRQERRQQQGQSATVMPAQVVERQEVAAVQVVAAAVEEQKKAVQQAVEAISPTRDRVVPPPRKPAPAMSPAELEADFKVALDRAGLIVGGAPVMDGKKHYVDVRDSKKGSKKGVYVGRLDHPPNGWFKNYKEGGDVQKWKPNVQAPERTPEEIAAWRAEQERKRVEREAAQQAAHDKVALIATKIWNSAPEVRSHPYLEAKQVSAHGMRQNGKYLLIPIQDAAGNIRNLQWIPPEKGGQKLFGVSVEEGGKREWLGGQKNGLYTVLGGIEPGLPIAIAEGVASAATFHEMTGIPTAVALDSSNLKAVATTLRREHPDNKIIFAADNDHHLPRRERPLPNVGLEKAHEAALAVRGSVMAPKFEPHERGTDWNDYAAQHGPRLTEEVLRRALVEGRVHSKLSAADLAMESLNKAVVNTMQKGRGLRP